jgi:hypothetical protein
MTLTLPSDELDAESIPIGRTAKVTVRAAAATAQRPKRRPELRMRERLELPTPEDLLS